MAANYQCTYQYPAHINQIRGVILSPDMLNALKLKLLAENPTPNGAYITLRHGVSLASWGEDIVITLISMGDQLTQVSIRSECSMPTQIIDLGKNQEVVQQISSFISSRIGVMPTVVPQYGAYPPPQYGAPQYGAPQQGMRCPSCGAALTPGANFCTACGTPIGGSPKYY